MAPKILDKEGLKRKARLIRGLDDAEVQHAARDCDECVRQGIDPEAYAAEAGVYRAELRRRGRPLAEPLATRLADPERLPLAPEFVAWLRAVAQANDLTEDEAWARWENYARTCDGYGQSATKPEFLAWNKLRAPEEAGA